MMRVSALFNLKPQFCVAELQFEPLFQLPPTFFNKYKQHMYLKIKLMQIIGVFFSKDEILVKL